MSWSLSSFLADSSVGQWIAPRANGNDELEEAIRNGNLEKCSILIETNFKGVDHVNEMGDSYLHQAAFHGHVEVVRMLMAAGADIHGKGRRGYTPLHFAALRGHSAVVDFLLENGADVRIKNDSGKNCYEVAKLPSISQKLLPHLFKNPGGDAMAAQVPGMPGIAPAAADNMVAPPNASGIDYGNADGFGTSHYHDPTNPHYNAAYAQQHRAAVAAIAPPPTTADHAAAGHSAGPPSGYYQNGNTNVGASQKYVSYFGGSPAPAAAQHSAPTIVATPPAAPGSFSMPTATAPSYASPATAPSYASPGIAPSYTAPAYQPAYSAPDPNAPTPPAPPTTATTNPASPATPATAPAARGVNIFTPMAITTHNAS